ncbi:hypothetical protein D3C86_1817090 [compost metagenome]
MAWNHITCYRSGSFRKVITHATPQTNGSGTLIIFKHQFIFRPQFKDYTPCRSRQHDVLFHPVRAQPARLSGDVLLVHGTIDQIKEPRMAWMYSAGCVASRRFARRIATTGSWLPRRRSTTGTRMGGNFSPSL